MRLALVLAPGGVLDPAAVVRGGRTAEPRLLAAGVPPEAAPLALLGQDLQQAWRGPAPLAVAAAGGWLVEDETAYLLDPVRVEDGRIVEGPLRWGPALLADVAGYLAEALEGEPVQLLPGPPSALVVAEELAGPPALAAEPLVGRALDALPAGPPALLARLVAASAEAAAEHGKAGCRLFPHTPGGPAEVTPIREAWLGLGLSAVVGSRPEARVLAHLLGMTHVPARAGDEVARAAAEAALHDLVVVVCEDPPLASELEGLATPVLVVAGDAGPSGEVPLAWRGGGELGEGPMTLGALLG